MKSQLDLGVLFTGKLDASFDANIKRIKDALNTLQGSTAKMVQANQQQAKSWNNTSRALGSYIADVDKLLALQARWYGAKAILFAAIDVPMKMLKEGFDQLLRVDSAVAKLKRYDAMLGDFSSTSKEAAESVVELARALNLKYPVPFDEIIKSADRLRAAGVEISTVKNILEEFVRFQTAWPEVEMEKFTNAVVGMMNTFRKTPGLRELSDDAERYKVVLDKLTVALGVGVIQPKDVNLVMQHFGQMAQSISLSVDQMLAMSVLVTNLGAKAGPAARALAGLATSLVQEDKLALLKKVGIEVDKNIPLGHQFIRVLESIRKLVGTGETGMSVSAQSFLGKLVPVERQKAFLAVLRDLDTYKDLIELIGKASDANRKAAEEMNKTLEAQIEIFKKWIAEVGKLPMEASTVGDVLKVLIGLIRTLGMVMLGWITIIKQTWLSLKFLSSLVAAFGLALYDISKLDFKSAADRFVNVWKGALLESEENVKKHNKTMDLLWGVSGKEKTEGEEWEERKRFEFAVNENRRVRMGLQSKPRKYEDVYGAKKRVSKRVGENEYPTVDIPGVDKYPSLIASEKSYLNARLAIYDAHSKTLINNLKNLFAEASIDEDFYNKMTIWNAEDTYNKKLEIINKQKEAIVSLYNKAMKDESYVKDETKRTALREQKEADLEKLRKQEIEAFDEKQRNIDDNRHDRIVRNIERVKQLRETDYNLSITQIAKEKELLTAHVVDSQKQTEFLYENKMISAVEYYKRLAAYIEANYNIEKKALDDNFETFLNKNVKEEIAAREDKDKKAQIQQEFFVETEKYIKEAQKLELNKAESTRELLRKQSVEIENIFGKDGMMGVLKKSIEDYLRELEQMGERWKTIFDDVARAMSSSFEDVFFDVMQNDLKSLGDYFNLFLTSVQKSIARFLADQVTYGLLSAFGQGMWGSKFNTTTTGSSSSTLSSPYGASWSSGVLGQSSIAAAKFHRGTAFPGSMSVPSWLFNMAPRLHNGLRAGEFPAILERGETVYPKGGPNVEVNVTNESSAKVQGNANVRFDANKMVIGIVLKDIETNGPLGKIIRGRG